MEGQYLKLSDTHILALDDEFHYQQNIRDSEIQEIHTAQKGCDFL